MEPKYRSFPPAVPLKISKLLQYEYFSEIYKKYDCNFFRQILPYFSEIITTNKLQLLKFMYVPIQNFHKVPKVQIGIPFQPQIENKNPTLFELNHEVTFIKIAYQTHIIFQYLMNLNLSNVSIQRMKFQDKFWLLSEGVLKIFYFNDIVFRNDQRKQNGIIFLLDGEFKCFNKHKKPFKTIGKGYVIDLNGKLKKVKYEQKLMTDRFSFEDNPVSLLRQQQIRSVQQQSNEQVLYSLWSNSNTAKVLYVDMAVIKKYSINFEDQPIKIPPVSQINKSKKPVKPQIRLQLKSLMKYRRLKTEKQQNPGRFTHNIDTALQKSNKKFNLISCRTSSTGNHQLLLPIPVQEISTNEVLKSYTKDKQLYQKMLKQMSQRKHKKFFSNIEQDKIITKKQQLMPFFKQQLIDQKEKVFIKRRKTKQLWGNSSMEKENFLINARKLVEEVSRGRVQSKNIEKSHGLVKKVNRTQLSAFQLLKRNLFNKEYHKVDFVQINS